MTLKECYTALEGDYDQAMSRLHSEDLIKRFVLKFPEQSGYDALCAAWDAEEYKEAFRAAHTMKGLCLNLNLTKLAKSSSKLTEALRNGVTEDAPALLEEVKEDYKQTLEAIQGLEE